MKSAGRTASLSKRRLRNWILMLGVTRMAENHLREYLRINHATTLPRFDVMAAMWRRPDGITMTELSRMLLVSNGNSAAVVDRLVEYGVALRKPSETDRRTVFVLLTPEGKILLEAMAAGHEAEVNRLFAALDGDDLESLAEILAPFRNQSPLMGAAA